MIKKSFIKIICLLIIIGLNWAGLLAVGQTFAYFVDNEDSNANLYQAGVLDFSLSSLADFSPSNLTPCRSVSRDISIVNNGNIFKYTVRATEFSGDLCGNLNLAANLDGVEKYTGSLTTFNHGPVEFSGPEDWNFVVSLNSNDLSLQNKSCQFKFVFEGWQTNLLDSSSGFSDTEEITNTVATGDWLPQVTVIYPNGGEIWYIVPPAHVHDGFGRYKITWEATSPVYNQDELLIDIWFCKESGANCFYQIADNTENDGSYWWTVPYESRFVTHKGRIKIVATDPCSFSGEDMSDADFCPPMLTEAQVLEMLALMTEPPEEPAPEESIEEEVVDEIVEEEPIVEEPIVEGEPTEEEVTTEENQEEGGIIEEINETIDEVINEIVEEIMPDEPADEEISTEETPVIDETAVIEETPVVEETVIEQAPATEEQPMIAPDNTNSNSTPTPESGGDTSGSDDGGSGNSIDGGSGGEMGTIEAPISE